MRSGIRGFATVYGGLYGPVGIVFAALLSPASTLVTDVVLPYAGISLAAWAGITISACIFAIYLWMFGRTAFAAWLVARRAKAEGATFLVTAQWYQDYLEYHRTKVFRWRNPRTWRFPTPEQAYRREVGPGEDEDPTARTA